MVFVQACMGKYYENTLSIISVKLLIIYTFHNL